MSVDRLNRFVVMLLVMGSVGCASTLAWAQAFSHTVARVESFNMQESGRAEFALSLPDSSSVKVGNLELSFLDNEPVERLPQITVVDEQTGQFAIIGDEQVREGAYDLRYHDRANITVKSVSLGTVFWRHHGRFIQFLAPRDAVNDALPPAYARWTEQDKARQVDAARRMIADIYDQLKAGSKHITIKCGQYRFDDSMRLDPKDADSAVFDLENLQDVEIDANGATFWLTQRDLPLINLKNCTRVTLRNMQIDLDPLPYIQGRIVKVDRGENPGITFQLSPGFEQAMAQFPKQGLSRIHIFKDDDAHSLPLSPTWVAGLNQGRPTVYDPVTRLVRTSLTIAKEARDLPQWGLGEGDLVALTPRIGGKTPIQVYNDHGLTIENVNVYASGRFGFFLLHAFEPVTFRHYTLTRRPATRRLVSSNMDGIHMKFCRVGPMISDSVLEGVMDDSIVVNSMNSRTLAQYASTQIVVTTRHQAFPINLVPGSKVLLYNMKKPAPVQSANVLEVKKYIDNQALPSQRVKHKDSEQPYIVVLDQPVDVSDECMVVSNLWGGNGYVIDNCYITNGWANAMRLTGHDGIIRNNTFEHTLGLTMAIQGYWYIGTELSNILIQNNRFIDTARGRGYFRPISVEGPNTMGPIHDNVQIIDNQFIDCDHAALLLKAIKNLVVKDNLFRQTNRLSNPDQDPTRRAAVILIGCPNPVLENNHFEQTGSADKPIIQQ